MNKKLPKPGCYFGYTDEQTTAILGERLEDFNLWMVSQTRPICDGRIYDHNTRTYESTGCGPCGYGVVYPWDLTRFLAGLPVVD